MKKKIEYAMGIILLLMVFLLCATVNMSAKEKNVNKRVCVAIDAGHGGSDPGKVSAKGILEKDINLAISKKIKSRMEKKYKDIEIIMTRTDDNDLHSKYADNHKQSDMYNRMKLVNEAEADILVSIHQNSFSSARERGAQVFYYNNSEEGEKLADAIQKSLKENVSEYNTREKKANTDYYILRNSKCPAVIIECGFLSNADEAWLLTTEDYQEKVADAVIEGIMCYIGRENSN